MALELYLKNRESLPGKTSAIVESLSGELNLLQARLGNIGSTSFRNPTGVYLKLMNLRGHDPQYTSQGKVGMRHGNKLEPAIWNEFYGREEELSKTCQAIRGAMTELADATLETEEDGFAEAAEGKLLTLLHRKRERSPLLVSKKKNWALKRLGAPACEACDFNFAKVYGERGRGFIECHHTQPVSEFGDGHKTTTNDLVLLCANCRRVVHAKYPWLTISVLKTALSSV